MSRYADHSQEILYRDGKLVGFNAGYGFHAEHEFGYKGMEQMQPKKSYGKKIDNLILLVKKLLEIQTLFI